MNAPLIILLTSFFVALTMAGVLFALLTRADNALYKSKAFGRNQTQFA